MRKSGHAGPWSELADYRSTRQRCARTKVCRRRRGSLAPPRAATNLVDAGPFSEDGILVLVIGLSCLPNLGRLLDSDRCRRGSRSDEFVPLWAHEITSSLCGSRCIDIATKRFWVHDSVDHVPAWSFTASRWPAVLFEDLSRSPISPECTKNWGPPSVRRSDRRCTESTYVEPPVVGAPSLANLKAIDRGWTPIYR